MGAAGAGWAWNRHESTAGAEARIFGELLDLNRPEARREFDGNSMAMIGVYIIKSFVKSNRHSRRCCAYLIWTVEKFTNQNWRWD